MKTTSLFRPCKLVGLLIGLFSCLSANAGGAKDSTNYLLHAKAIADSTRSSATAKKDNDSTSFYFSKKIALEYERLEALNDANEREGTSYQNMYVINPGSFELEDGVWIRNLSADPQNSLLQTAIYKRINKRLRDFNDAREDNLRMYVVVSFDFKAYLKSNQTPDVDEFVLKANLDKYFAEDQSENILNFVYGDVPRMINEVDDAMDDKGYGNRIIYTFTGINYYTSDLVKHMYKMEGVQIVTATEKDADGNEDAGSSKLVSLSKKIRSKARIKMKPKESIAEHIETVVENLITAIEIEYDRKENISDKGVTDCGKPIAEIIKETWPLSETRYKEVLQSFVATYTATDAKQGIKFHSPYVLVDDLSKFESGAKSNAILPDVGFIREILPDKVNLMDGRSDYQVYVFFKEVDFVIPINERAGFAQAVYEWIGLSSLSGKKIILITVPYYSCKSNPQNYSLGGRASSQGFPMLLMPVAYGPDSELNTKMNAAFLREESFRSGFDQAFKNIPKRNIAYVWKVLWNGSLEYSGPKVTERCTLSSNFYDCFVLVDERLTKIKDDYYKARDVDGRFTKKFDDQYGGDKGVNFDKTIAEFLKNNPEPKFSELNKNVCNLKQSVMAANDAEFLAEQYAMASVERYIDFVIVNGGISTSDVLVPWSVTMEDNQFYEKKNPFEGRSFILSFIDAGSLLAQFVGLDFIFDGAGFVTAVMLGEAGEAAQYGASIFIPGSIAAYSRLAAKYKTYKASKTAVKALEAGKAVLVVSSKSTGELLQVGMDIAHVRPLANDGVDLLRAVGVSNPEVLAVTKADPTLGDDIESAIVHLDGDVVKENVVSVTNPGAEKYGPDQIRDRLNREPNLVNNYKKARGTQPRLPLVDFLKTIDNAPRSFYLAPRIKAIKDEEGYFTLVVMRVQADGSVMDASGKKLSVAELAELMEKNGYQPGDQIRVVSLLPGDGKNPELLADALAEKYVTTAKTHHGEVLVTEAGELVAKEGGILTWAIKDYAYLPSPKEMMVGNVGLENFDMRSFIIVPSKVKPDGSVVCKVNGRLQTLSPRELATEIKKSGLREDDLPILALRKNSTPADHENLVRTAEELASELGTRVKRTGDPEVFFDYNGHNQFNKKGVDAGKSFDAHWVIAGERKPLLLLSEANHAVDDVLTDGSFTVVVDMISNGKVKYKKKELTPSEFLKVIKEEGEYDGKRSLRLAAKKTDESAGEFVARLSEEAKVPAKINKQAIQVADGGVLSLKNLKPADWLSHAPLGKGKYFVSNNMGAEYLRNLVKEFGDDFAEQFGLGLSLNSGKYVKPFKENPEWVKLLYADYKLMGSKSISMPSFVNLQSIAKQLDIKFIDDARLIALKKKIYDNPLLGKNLDLQLKYLDGDDLDLIKKDLDLFKQALAFVEEQTIKNGTGDLPYFMAREHLIDKLSKEAFAKIDEQYFEDVYLITTLGQEVKKLDAASLEKFNYYAKNRTDDWLDEFNNLRKTPGRQVNLAEYLSLVQRKNQVVFAGSGDNLLLDAANKLLPQEGYMDVFLRTDGTRFYELANSTKKYYTPEEVADLIRQNEHWDERPLRLMVRGENAATDVKPLTQKLIDDLEAEGSKINPKDDFRIADDGKLVGRWENLTPVAGSLARGSKPRLVPLGFGNDAAVTQALGRLEKNNKPDIVFHTAMQDGEEYIAFTLDEGGHTLEYRVDDVEHMAQLIRDHVDLSGNNPITLFACPTASNLQGEVAQGLANQFPGKKFKAFDTDNSDFAKLGVSPQGEPIALDKNKVIRPRTYEKGMPPKAGEPIRLATPEEMRTTLPLRFIQDSPPSSDVYRILKDDPNFMDYLQQLVDGETIQKYKGILTQEEETALMWYVREGPALNYEMVFSNSLSEFHSAMAKTINEALTKLNIPYHGTVYRGIGEAEFKFLKEAYSKPSKEVLFKDFKSTSKSQSVALGFNQSEGNGVRYLGVFHSHQGIDISKTRNGMEEVLLKDKSRFKITSIDDPVDGVVKIHFEDINAASKIADPSIANGVEGLVTEVRKVSDARMIASLGKDAATVQAAARLKSGSGKFYVVVHGEVTTAADGTAMFWVLHNGEWKGINHRSLTRWLEAQPHYKEVKTIHLVSCGGASTDLAQNFANKAKKEVMAAGGEIGVVSNGEIVALGGKADEWKLLKPANSSTPPPTSAGPIRAANTGEDALPLVVRRVGGSVDGTISAGPHGLININPNRFGMPNIIELPGKTRIIGAASDNMVAIDGVLLKNSTGELVVRCPGTDIPMSELFETVKSKTDLTGKGSEGITFLFGNPGSLELQQEFLSAAEKQLGKVKQSVNSEPLRKVTDINLWEIRTTTKAVAGAPSSIAKEVRDIAWARGLEKSPFNSLPGNTVEAGSKDLNAIFAFQRAEEPGINNLVVYIDKADKGNIWVHTGGGDWRKIPRDGLVDYLKVNAMRDTPRSYKIFPYKTDPTEIVPILQAAAQGNPKMMFHLPEKPVYLSEAGNPLGKEAGTEFKGIGNSAENPKLANPKIPKGPASAEANAAKEALKNAKLNTEFIRIDQNTAHINIYVSVQSNGATKKVVVAEAGFENGWIHLMDIDVKRGVNSEYVANGEKVFEQLYNEFVNRFGANNIVGIKCGLVEDNLAKLNEELARRTSMGVNFSNKEQKLKNVKEAIFETPTGKAIKKLDFQYVEFDPIDNVPKGGPPYSDGDIAVSFTKKASSVGDDTKKAIAAPKDLRHNWVSNPGSIDKTAVEIYAPETSKPVATLSLSEEGYVGGLVNVKIGPNGESIAKGEEVFMKAYNEIIKKYGPNRVIGIKGIWDASPHLRDNFDTFNKLIPEIIGEKTRALERKLSRSLVDAEKKLIMSEAAREAAAKTFTGTMAERLGYKVDRVVGVADKEGKYPTEVTVFFKRITAGLSDAKPLIAAKSFKEILATLRDVRTHSLPGISKQFPRSNSKEELDLLMTRINKIPPDDVPTLIMYQEKGGSKIWILDNDSWFEFPISKSDPTLQNFLLSKYGNGPTYRVLPLGTNPEDLTPALTGYVSGRLLSFKVPDGKIAISSSTAGDKIISLSERERANWQLIKDPSTSHIGFKPSTIPAEQRAIGIYPIYLGDYSLLSENVLNQAKPYLTFSKIDDAAFQESFMASLIDFGTVNGADRIFPHTITFSKVSNAAQANIINSPKALHQIPVVGASDFNVITMEYYIGDKSFSIPDGEFVPILMTKDGKFLVHNTTSETLMNLPNEIAFSGTLSKLPNDKYLIVDANPFYNRKSGVNANMDLYIFIQELRERYAIEPASLVLVTANK